MKKQIIIFGLLILLMAVGVSAIKDYSYYNSFDKTFYLNYYTQYPSSENIFKLFRNNATVTPLDNGVVNNGILFNGTQLVSDYITTSNYIYNNNSNVTFSFWIKPNGDNDNSEGGVIYQGASNSGGLLISILNDTVLRVTLRHLNSTEDPEAPSFTLGRNQWSHVSLVFYKNSSSDYAWVDYYVNGTYRESDDFDAIPISGIYMPKDLRLYIGANGETQTRKLNASLDELIIYPRKLTPSEIYQLYSNPTILYEDITLNWSVDGNTLGAYKVTSSGNNRLINLSLDSDKLNQKARLDFYINNATGKNITTIINYVSGYQLFNTTNQGFEMSYSCDDVNWNTIGNYTSNYPTNYIFWKEFECLTPHIAVHPFLSRTNELLYYQNSSRFNITSIGHTEENRDFLKATFNDSDLSSKLCVISSSRIHPSESTANYIFMGLYEFLNLSSNASNFNNVSFIMFPDINADGVSNGYSRSVFNATDPNRDYLNITINNTKILISQLLYYNNTCADILFLDFHSDETNGVNHINSLNRTYVDLSVRNKQDSFISIFQYRTFYKTYFNVGDDYYINETGNGYASVNLSIPSFTLENDHHNSSITISELKSQGVNIAYAIADYYGVNLSYVAPVTPVTPTTSVEVSSVITGLSPFGTDVSGLFREIAVPIGIFVVLLIIAVSIGSLITGIFKKMM